MSCAAPLVAHLPRARQTLLIILLVLGCESPVERVVLERQPVTQVSGGLLSSRAEDVADAIRYAYEAPQNVCIREIVLAATHQPA